MAAVRHDYFSRITRPIQAYVLGLIASDGNVSASRPRIQFNVHERDRILAECVRDELAPASPILQQRHAGRSGYMAKVHLTSPQLCADLAGFGIIPKKSHVLAWPDALPADFINSYLLGMYDGDGSLTMDRRKREPYYVCGIMSASPLFLERASSAINAATGVPEARLSGVNGRAFSIRYGGKSAHTLDRWLHQDCSGLPRKRIPHDARVVAPPTTAD